MSFHGRARLRNEARILARQRAHFDMATVIAVTLLVRRHAPTQLSPHFVPAFLQPVARGAPHNCYCDIPSEPV
jgi:hypothetical protein